MMILSKNPVSGFTTKRARAFTLIETLIAVTILALAAAGPLVTASRALVAAQLSRDQLIASQLAQEGLEYIHTMRDKQYLVDYLAGGGSISTNAWTNFISGASAQAITQCKSPAMCSFDPWATGGMCTGANCTLEVCPAGVCKRLRLGNNGTTNVYTVRSDLGDAPSSRFIRSIQIFDISATEVRVVSTVKWDYHSVTYQIVVSDHLTQWQ